MAFRRSMNWARRSASACHIQPNIIIQWLHRIGCARCGWGLLKSEGTRAHETAPPVRRCPARSAYLQVRVAGHEYVNVVGGARRHDLQQLVQPREDLLGAVAQPQPHVRGHLDRRRAQRSQPASQPSTIGREAGRCEARTGRARRLRRTWSFRLRPVCSLPAAAPMSSCRRRSLAVWMSSSDGWIWKVPARH